MATPTYCTDTLVGFESNACANEPGGIIAAGFVRVGDEPTDWESNTDWTTGIAAIEIFPIYQTRGEYAGGTPNETDDAWGEAGSALLGIDHTVTYEHRGIHIGTGGARTNITEYNKLMNLPGQYLFYWVDSGYKLWVTTKATSVSAKQIVPKSKKEQEYWQVEVKWTDLENPQTYDAPVISYTQP